MELIRLPESFKGPWHHAFILTFGLNLELYETAIWRQFGASCTNKVVLADGSQFLKKSAQYAEDRLLRYINSRYVAEGIFCAGAAHAKLIFLASPERGRMLVGSGNLGMQGYASGGEIFSEFRVSPEETDDLGSFLTALEFLKEIVDRGYVSDVVQYRIRHMEESTPWLFTTPRDPSSSIWHNLNYSLLRQLQDEVGEAQVRELTIHSPFFDEELAALEMLVGDLQPQRLTIFVQKNRTSMDPRALEALIDRISCQTEVRPVSLVDDPSCYLHAKLYLINLEERDICFHGSPNASISALLRTDPVGNIEIASLHNGPRGTFDHLFDQLSIENPTRSYGELQLEFRGDRPTEVYETGVFHLLHGSWRDNALRLSYRGPTPDTADLLLLMANRRFPAKLEDSDETNFTFQLSRPIIQLLDEGSPVAVGWSTDGEFHVSNFIFPGNLRALDDELQVGNSSGTLSSVGPLDLDDAELEGLLWELGDALILDDRDLWSVAGRSDRRSAEAENGIILKYEELDLEALGRHPKVLQYTQKTGPTSSRYAPTRLQIILNSISAHFNALNDQASAADEIPELSAGPDDQPTELESQSEEERELMEKKRAILQQKQDDRNRRFIRRFIDRYLSGVGSPGFQEAAGPMIMTKNYFIFEHILWKLFGKDFIEPEYVTESVLRIWAIYWGDDQSKGYIAGLPEEERTSSLKWLNDQIPSASALALAAVFYGSQLTRTESWERLRLNLRDFWRRYLMLMQDSLNVGALEAAWKIIGDFVPPEPPLPKDIIDELVRLGSFETRQSFIASLIAQFEIPAGSISFERVKVHRTRKGTTPAECLVISTDSALGDRANAEALIQKWIRCEKRDYYRIAYPDAHKASRIIFYEATKRGGHGLYLARDLGIDEVQIGLQSPSAEEWESPLDDLKRVGNSLTEQIAIVRYPAGIVAD